MAGIKEISTIARESRVPQGGISKGEMFKRKMNKITISVLLAGMMTASLGAIPEKAHSIDIGGQFERQMEWMAESATRSAVDRVGSLIGGIITGRTQENERQRQHEAARRDRENRREDLSNELRARGISTDKVRVEIDDSDRVILRGVLTDERSKNVVLMTARRYVKSDRDIIDRIFIKTPGSEPSFQKMG